MKSDKEILFQMLNREVDNILMNFGPFGNLASGPVKKYLYEMVSPYVDAFLNSNESLNASAATEFTKEQVNDKVDAFLKKFNAERAKTNGERL
jgi:ferric iron reductase protein FhuF